MLNVLAGKHPDDGVEFLFERVEANVHALEPGIDCLEPGVDCLEPGVDRVEPGADTNEDPINASSVSIHATKTTVDTALHSREPRVYPFLQCLERHPNRPDHTSSKCEDGAVREGGNSAGFHRAIVGRAAISARLFRAAVADPGRAMQGDPRLPTGYTQ
jgi:hypothetical protein